MKNNLSSLDRKILLTSSLTTARRFVFKMNLNGIKVVNYQTHTLSSLLRELLDNPKIRIVGSEESAYILLKLIESNFVLISFLFNFINETLNSSLIFKKVFPLSFFNSFS